MKLYNLAVLFSVVLAVGTLCWSEPCSGQGVLIDESGERCHLPRPWPRPRPEPPRHSYHLRELTVDASIRHQIATTQVTQVFHNTGPVQIEASFVFPLPYDGAVERMTFLVDGKEYEAKLLPREEARRIYENYVRRNQDPALLEWIGTGMFKTSVFPIPPGASRTVTLRYSQLLRRDGDLTDYLFPLSTAKYTTKPIDKFSLRIAIAADDEIKSIYSPTHDIHIQRDDARNAVVTAAASSVVPSTDFRLMYNSRPGKVAASLLTHWPADEDQGFFMLLASPQFDAGHAPPPKRTVIFVVDQSGSMSGPKIEQARQSAKFVINNLHANDLFNVIAYESNVQMMSPELLRFSEETRQQAIGFINGIQAGGGTNIHQALQTALAQIADATTPSYLVFLTDGLPTVGETNELRIAEACRTANRHRTRIISFGVGYDVNSRLLDRISRENHGASEYVRPNEDVEASVARLFKKMSSPVLTDLKLDFRFDRAHVEVGPPVNRMYPSGLSDLFAGSQLVIVGRYRVSGNARLTLSGNVGDRQETFQFDLHFAERGAQTTHGYLAQLWAMRRIGEIVDLIDLHGRNEELVAELVRLATRFGIVTPYTSFLADEHAPVTQLTDSHRNQASANEALAFLERDISGSSGFFQRANKQEMKIAGNLSQIGGAGKFGMADGQFDDSQMQGQAPAGVRQVGNAAVYKRGNVIVASNAVNIDLEKDKDKIIELERFSGEYFDLLSQTTAEENAILAQQQPGEELIIAIQGKVYRVR